jgi:hypothetical protein
VSAGLFQYSPATIPDIAIRNEQEYLISHQLLRRVCATVGSRYKVLTPRFQQVYGKLGVLSILEENLFAESPKSRSSTEHVAPVFESDELTLCAT